MGGTAPYDNKVLYTMDSMGGVPGSTEFERVGKVTPCRQTNYPQIRLEPLLSNFAQERGKNTVFYSHKVLDVEEVDDGVVVTVLDRATDKTIQAKAKYVVSADGGKTVGPKVMSSFFFPFSCLKSIDCIGLAWCKTRGPNEHCRASHRPHGGGF
jgi:2,4-dichlorophenol 6-monooxygenase